jgi:hypothetical protein
MIADSKRFFVLDGPMERAGFAVNRWRETARLGA